MATSFAGGALRRSEYNIKRATAVSAYENAIREKAKQKEAEEEKNQGGLFGGIGYLTEKLGLGFLQSVEGIADFTVGGLAKLFGADDWAEEIMSSDWVDYTHADDWFNPDSGWKVAGDVAGGIGTSVPAIATAVGITLASGGTAAPLAVGAASAGVAGLGAAGTATKEAYQKSGQLSGKEFGYGALSGLTEAGIEALSNVVGFGSGSVIKGITNGLGKGTIKGAAKSAVKTMAKTAAKEAAESAAATAAKSAAKTAAKTVAKKTLGKELLDGFVGEAFEEGFAEFISPFWARATYDPDAQMATPQEIMYASFVGGLSGMIMSGTNAGVDSGVSFFKGNSINGKGQTAEVMGLSDIISKYEAENATSDEDILRVSETYTKLSESLKDTGGAVQTVTQKKLLGDLHRENTAAIFKPAMINSAKNAVVNADALQVKLAEMGITNADGSAITAEQIRAGLDVNDRKSFGKALKENHALRTVAAMDVAGRLMTDSKRLTDASLRGKALASRVDLANFATTASPAEKQVVSEALGIDDWTKLDADSFNKKIVEFVENGGVERYKQLRELIKNADTLPEADARPMPKFMNMQKDGIIRYSDENSRIAVMKNGDTFRLYDYDLRTVSKELTRTEVNAALREYNTKKNAVTSMNQQNMQVTETVDGSVGAAVATDTNVGGNDITNVTSDGKRFAIKYPTFSDSDISDNINALADMDAVETIDSSKLEKTGKKPIELFNEFFDSLGNNITSETFGDIALSKSSAKSEIRHGITAEKIASIEAIPTVIEKGKVIFSKTKAGSDVERIVIAAPIKIGQDDYYMGVMLQRDTQSQRLYLHNVVAVKAEEATTSSQDNSLTNWSDEDNSRLFITSILQKAVNVKVKKQKNISKVQAVEKSAAELDSIAKENIPEYSKLSLPTRVMIRKVLYDALAVGYSEYDAIMFARVSARSGLHMMFSKKLCFAGIDKDTKKLIHADGYYDPYGNRIVINPEGTRSVDALLIHELTHAIYKDKRGRIILERGAKNMSDKQKQSIIKSYSKGRIALNAPKGSSAVIMEEMNAHYIEGQLKNKNLLEALLSDEPTLKDKILSFFKGASTDYAGNAELSGAAKRLFKRYKKLFDSFSAQNQDTNAYGAAVMNSAVQDDGKRFALIGRTEDGRGIYKSNYPENTPKTQKQKDIIDFVQNVWSKKPIKLNLVVDGKTVPIEANFNPELTERSDLSKIAFGNRKGTASEKRITMNLSSDLYQIAEESRHVGSKSESGKDNAAHTGVTTWHYFLTDLVYVEADGKEIECYMNIDVKQNNSGHWFYSFAIEKGSRPADVLSVVTDKSATTSTNSISQNSQNVNTNSEKNSSKRFALPEGVEIETVDDIIEGISQGGHEFNGYRAFINRDTGGIGATVTVKRPDGERIRQRIDNGRYLKDSELWEYAAAMVAKEKGLVSFEGNDISDALSKLKKSAEDALTETLGTKTDEFNALLDERTEVGRRLKELTFGSDRTKAAAERNFNDTKVDKKEVQELNDKIRELDKKIEKKGREVIAIEDRARILPSFEAKLRKNIQRRNRLEGLIAAKARAMKDLKVGKFKNATQAETDTFNKTIMSLGRIDYRGNMNQGGTRKILSELKDWYIPENPVLMVPDPKNLSENSGLYVPGIAEKLSSLSSGKSKQFTMEELNDLYDLLSYFVKFVENYGKVFYKGKMVEALPIAKNFIKIAEENENLKGVAVSVLRRKLWGYKDTFLDPASLMRMQDLYNPDGFYTSMFDMLREATMNSDFSEFQILSIVEEFFKKNKNYLENASGKKSLVEYHGHNIPKIQLIDLYMSMGRKHAHRGIIESGFVFRNLDGHKEHDYGFVERDVKLTDEEITAKIEEQRKIIEKLLTPTDLEYTKILDKIYNEDAKRLKSERDFERYGFTNALDGYYYPIRRYATDSTNIDADYKSELDRASNPSFNKDTVAGAKQAIIIESAHARMRRHVRAICDYAYLSPALQSFNILYSLDTSEFANHPTSVKTVTENTWNRGYSYLKKLISDIQGIPSGSKEGQKILGAIRGSYAKFQLGANPKVWFTQGSSIFASSSILDASSISYGMSHYGNATVSDVFEYCPLAKLRAEENTSAFAQAVLDSDGRALTRAERAGKSLANISDKLMVPIGKVDEFIIRRLYAACQHQVAKNNGPEIGSVENKKAAGELLTKVILETQQNTMATERSAAMRSDNEVLRTFTMFTSDAMKVIGRVIDGFGEFMTVRARMKATTDEKTLAALGTQKKAAGKKLGKALAALTTSAVYMAALGQLFAWLYGKDKEEEESVIVDFSLDVLGNTLGGLPVISDAVSFFIDGYGVESFTYASINDILTSAKQAIEATGDIISGEGDPQKSARATRNLIYTIGQVTGIPFRNVYNIFYGTTKRFISPEAAFNIDNAFYAKNYRNELYKALEKGDDRMVAHIMSLILGERVGNADETVSSELIALAKADEKVLPHEIPDEITVNDVEYAISPEQQAGMMQVSSLADKDLKKLFSRSAYKGLSNENKALAVDYIYDLYYDKAVEDVLGVDRKNSALAFIDAVGADVFALLHIYTRGLESDKDKDGNTVAGSKRKKVIAAISSLGISTEQKLLLIAAKGYSISDGDVKGVSASDARRRLLKYILSLKGLSAARKAEIAELCGFTVKNGKIVKDF